MEDYLKVYPELWELNHDDLERKSLILFDSSKINNIHSSVLEVPLFSDEMCRMLFEEIDSFCKFASKFNRKMRKAGRFEDVFHHGSIINRLGLQDLFSPIINGQLTLISKEYFPLLVHSDEFLDDSDFIGGTCPFESNLQLNEFPHDDESILTVTILLTNEFSGGEMKYHIGRLSPCGESDQEEYLLVKPLAGHAVIHAGNLIHNVQPVSSGKRKAIVLWLLPKVRTVNTADDQSLFYPKYLQYLSEASKRMGPQPPHHQCIEFHVPRIPKWAQKRLEFHACSFLSPGIISATMFLSPDILSLIWPRIEISSLKTLRIVCNTWKISIDLHTSRYLQTGWSPILPLPFPSRLPELHSLAFQPSTLGTNTSVINSPEVENHSAILWAHLGGAGTRIGAECWSLFRKEHENSSSFEYLTHYSQLQDGTAVPLALFACQGDFVPPQEIPFVKMLEVEDVDPDNGREHSAAFRCMDSLRRMSETRGKVGGLILQYGAGGKSGSSLSSSLIRLWEAQMGGKVATQGHCLLPSNDPILDCSQETASNTLLCLHQNLDYLDTQLLFDNPALFRVCSENLQLTNPSYRDLNSVIAQAISGATAGQRFDSALNVDLAEFQQNLVPYPRLSFILSSLAPLLPRRGIFSTQPLDTVSITLRCCEPGAFLANCDPTSHKYMAAAMLYRGNVLPKDVMAACGQLKTTRTMMFVDWCPTGFKCGITYQSNSVLSDSPLSAPDSSCLMLSNTSAIEEIFRRHLCSYKTHSSEIKEETRKEQLHESVEDLEQLCQDYDEAACSSEEDYEGSDEDFE